MLKRCAKFLFFFLFSSILAYGNGGGNEVEFTANQGQWHPNVLYRAEVSNGLLYMESNAFTWLFYSGSPLAHHGTGNTHTHSEEFKTHAYQVRFEGANGSIVNGQNKLAHFRNFFLGNDQSKWASKVPVYSDLYYEDLYPGVDLEVYGHGAGLKYDLILDAGQNAEQIKMQYDGADELWIEDGHLHVRTSVNEVIENAPYAYQYMGERRVEVPCEFVLDGNTVSFGFSEGYDIEHVLVIDPVLTFASYSGSSADNYGFTATYDRDGNLYGGGIVFSAGAYPTTMGAYQVNHGGGTIDMGISKFSSDGSTLIYSTHIGGLGNESPHSLVVNGNNELYILGSSGSNNYPTVANGFDITFGGGPALTFNTSYGYSHPNGSDIVISRLSADGTNLLSSTYLGGSNNDGLNNSSTLSYNYGDEFRGEIIVDGSNNVLIVSSTSSTNFPTTPGAPQGGYGGGTQDAVVAKLNQNLSTLLWSTFHGGSDADSGFGIQLSSSGQIYITGGTSSSDLPTAGIPLDGSFNGTVDPYIARYSSSGNSLLACTYLGTSAYDQSYFVQLDLDDKVYVVGQTTGAYPVSPNVWNNPGSGQFIHKLSNDLSVSEWSTVIGTGNGTIDISPSAFLVSNCGQIYFSGWGGTVNNGAQPNNSTTLGLPITNNAFQTWTDGSDFYLLVLEPDADTIAYATFFGGAFSSEHVDGGTSRFDKDGNVYQAVCAGCGGNNDFPTTTGAYSQTNGSNNCNLGVFKFNLATITSEIDINGPAYICQPDSAEFINLSLGGTDFLWLFGDGQTSTEYEPHHYYQDTGTYIVQFILYDSTACIIADTSEITIAVFNPFDAMIQPADSICEGGSVQLFASGGYSFEWFPTTGLSQSTISNPIATPPNDGFTYSVIVTDSCVVDTVSISLYFFQETFGTDPAPAICAGDTIQLNAYGGGTYSWTPDPSLINNASATPSVFPADTTMYFVEITSPNGCVDSDSVLVEVEISLPVTNVTDASICPGNNVQLFASGGNSYEWNPAPGIVDLFIPNPFVEPIVPTTYYVNISNGCGTVLDSSFVDVVELVANAWPDTIICKGESVQIFASGGTIYTWLPAGSLSDPSIADPIASPDTATTYIVEVSDVGGCVDTAQVTIDLNPTPDVDAGNDVIIYSGESTILNGSGIGSFLWTPNMFLDCTTCEDPTSTPPSTISYTLELTDENGCKNYDVVTVHVSGNLFAPNTFSPNSDGLNDVFYAHAIGVEKFNLMIFNRWGELIFETNDLFKGWDGTYKSTDSPIGTYVWKIDLTEVSGDSRQVIGHVNLIR